MRELLIGVMTHATMAEERAKRLLTTHGFPLTKSVFRVIAVIACFRA